jgi:hypothetical protein
MQFSRRWSIHDWLDEAYMPFFGAFGTSGGGMGPPAAVQHPVVFITAG